MATLAATVAVPIVFGPLCDGVGQPVRTVASIDDAGVLRIGGGMDEVLVDAVQSAIDGPHAAITRILIGSGGGQLTAMGQVKAILAPLDIPIEVPDGNTCQSACVGLLATHPAGFVIAPTATVMFHAEAPRFGLASTGLCGCVNAATVADGLASQWLARQFGAPDHPLSGIDERLPEAFRACWWNPLHTRHGMTVTGAEITALKDGSIAPDQLRKNCP